MPRERKLPPAPDRGAKHDWMLENAPPARENVERILHGIFHHEHVYMGPFRLSGETGPALIFVYVPFINSKKTTCTL